MECPRCQFHNMPGLTTCFRCGSVLTSDQVAIDVHPPRALGIAKPFRAIERMLRRYFYYEKIEDSGKTMRWFWRVSLRGFNAGVNLLGQSVFSIIVSLIPGLQQIIDGNFHSVKKYCITWLVLILVGLFFYGSNIGLFLIGLALGVHAWITLLGWNAIHSGVNVFRRLRMVATVIIAFGIVYWLVGRQISNSLPHTFTSQDYPYYNVHSGHLLVGRNLDKDDLSHLRRGDLVMVNASALYDGHRGQTFKVVGQIVGMPGDVIDLKKDHFVVNGEELKADHFPVPDLFHGRELTISVPSDCYFIACDYTINAHGATEQMVRDVLRNGCLFRHDDLIARMTFRWLPVLRRGFLKELE
ncbi:MAG: hypothetical protein GX629_09540 [Phycisphaerae bacterium]|jgi:hypothetical protein|nr:hypothetical protein [Phycisphaerae bacterium]